MQFANMNMIWLLAVLLPLMALFLVWSWRRRARLIERFIRSRLAAELIEGVSVRVLKLRMAMMTAAVAAIVLALARPQWGQSVEEVSQRGLDVVVAVDTSRSMLAQDVLPNRLERAKLAILDLMALCKSDRLALIAFAGSAFLQCPLTVDDDAFRQTLRALEVGIIPQGGTALAEAIDAALSAFKKGSENHKALVIFTDGEDHEAGVLEAAKKAAGTGMRIFTVGVGSLDGELLKLKDESGREDYVKDDQGNVVKSRLNSKLLSQVAASADGFYVPLSGARAMEGLYERGLALMPKGELTRRLTTQHREQFMWPLGLAIALLVVELVLGVEARPAKSSRANSPQKVTQTTGATLLLLIASMGSLHASSSSAKRHFDSGLYQESRKEYERLVEKYPKDPRYRYNAGAAAFRARQYQEAINHFAASLDPKDLSLQQSALYNLGNARFRQGEAEEDPGQKSAQWDQAARDFESALKLNPTDADARHNLQFVRQRLEELKKDPSKSDQSSPSDDKNEDKEKDESPDQDQDKNRDDKGQQQDPSSDKQDQDQKSSNSSEQDEKKDGDRSDQQGSRKSPEESKESAGSNDDKKEPGEPKDERGDGQPKPDPSKPADKEGRDGKQDASGESNPSDARESGAASAAQGRMTKEQADKLLDALKGSEKAMIFQPTTPRRSRTRMIKDW